MKKLQRAAVLLSLVEAMRERGSWCGETNVQKAVYFLQELAGVPLGFDFVLYRYGPYSFELTDELTALLADSILRLEFRDPRYGPSYGPGELRNLIANSFPKTVSRFRNRIDFVAERLGPRGVADLERLSTALFVHRKTPQASAKDKAARITTIKPHITQPDAEEAVKEVDKMIALVSDLLE